MLIELCTKHECWNWGGGEGQREHVLQFLQICRQNAPLHLTELPVVLVREGLLMQLPSLLLFECCHHEKLPP